MRRGEARADLGNVNEGYVLEAVVAKELFMTKVACPGCKTVGHFVLDKRADVMGLREVLFWKCKYEGCEQVLEESTDIKCSTWNKTV